MREDTAPTQGTTLEILAPYLPYGIEVQLLFSGLIMRKGDRLPLLGIDGTEEYPIRTGEASFKYPGVLPVLRPFAALVEPLPGGTVPALALAAIAVPEVRCVRAEILNAGFGQYHCACFGEQGQQYYAIHRNNFESVRGSKVKNRLDGDLTDYLRRNHFALPVNGRPLIEGVDYIPKSSGVPPIEKEAAS